MVYTATDRGSACPRAESPKFPSFFFDFPPAKRVLCTRSSNSLEIYHIKNFFFKGYESVNFRLRRARPEIRCPWTCSQSHTYMHHSNAQIHVLWPQHGQVPLLCGCVPLLCGMCAMVMRHDSTCPCPCPLHLVPCCGLDENPMVLLY